MVPRDGAGFPGRGDADAGEVLGGAASMDQVRLLDITWGLVVVLMVVLVLRVVVVGVGGGGVGADGGGGVPDGGCGGSRCWW